jgi:paraquat-inducible protein B
MKKVNPTALGLFLVIGLAFAVGGVVLFSSGTLFHTRVKYIVYFDGSLDGLNAGAPLKYRGVTVGRVEEVLIRRNQAEDDFAMPVIIGIDRTLAQSKSDMQLQIPSKERFAVLISRGMRARLDAESLVTGNLYVGLDFISDAPPPVFHQVKPGYEEIPSARSAAQQLWANLQRLDLPGLSAKLNTLMARADGKLKELDVHQINSGLTNLLGSANQFITAPDLTNAVRDAKLALADAQILLKRIDGRVDPLADNANLTLTDAEKTLTDLRGAIQKLSDMLGPDDAFRSDLTLALQQLGNASRAIADLSEFIKRNPDALLMGRKQPKE